jgi:hypothetical protein
MSEGMSITNVPNQSRTIMLTSSQPNT